MTLRNYSHTSFQKTNERDHGQTLTLYITERYRLRQTGRVKVEEMEKEERIERKSLTEAKLQLQRALGGNVKRGN